MGAAVPSGPRFARPIDVLFGEGDYLAPDYVFVRRDRLSIVSKRGVEGPPDLVVEVPSTSTMSRDRGIKRQRYAHFGVAEYWILDWSRKRAEIHRNTGVNAFELEIATEGLIGSRSRGGPP